MTKKEVISFIFLSEKYKGEEDSDILLNISENKTDGKIVNIGNFLYKIGEAETLIPIARIWDYLLSQVKGRKRKDYLKHLQQLLEKYPFPKDILKQLRFINPETGNLEYYNPDEKME